MLKKIIYTILLAAAGITPLYGQYDHEYEVGSGEPLNISACGTCSWRIYQTDPNPQEFSIPISMPNTNEITLILENLNIFSNEPVIQVEGAPRMHIIFKGKNTMKSISNEAMRINYNAASMRLEGDLTDTLILSSPPNKNALKIEHNLMFKGGVLLINSENDTIYATYGFEIYGGVIASTSNSLITFGSLLQGDIRYRTSNLLVRGGTVDKLVAYEGRIEGGSVRGVYGNFSHTTSNIRNSMLFKIYKPNVEGGSEMRGMDYTGYYSNKNIRRNHNDNDTLYLYIEYPWYEMDFFIPSIASGAMTRDFSHYSGGQHIGVTKTDTIPRIGTEIAVNTVNLDMVYGKTSSIDFGTITIKEDPSSVVDSVLPYDVSPFDILVRFNGKIIHREKNDIYYSLVDNFQYLMEERNFSGLNAGTYPISIEYGGSFTQKPSRWEMNLVINKDTLPHAAPQIVPDAFVLDSCKNIDLPTNDPNGMGTWSWKNPNDTVGFANISSRRCTARFTPNAGTINYHIIDTVLSINVNKRPPPLPPQTERIALSGDSLHNLKFGCWEWEDSSTQTSNSTNAPISQNFAAVYACDTDCCYERGDSILLVILPDNLPTGLQAIYLDNLSSVQLPAEWTWEHPTNLVGSVGKNYHEARFSIENGQYIGHRNLAVQVAKRRLPYNLQDSIIASYSDTLKSIPLWDKLSATLTHSDTGWTWIAPEEIFGSIGVQQCSARWTPLDAHNYFTLDTTLSVTVGKGYPRYTLPENLTASFGDTLSQVSLPADWQWQQPDDTVGYVGIRAHRAWFLHDTAHYFSVDTALDITVEKTNPTLPDAQDAVYGDTLKVIVLPSPWIWQNPDTLVGNAGPHPFGIRVKDEDTAYYAQIETTIVVNVQKATPSANYPLGLVSVYGELLQSVRLWDTASTTLTHLDTGWCWANPIFRINSAGGQRYRAIFTPIDTINYQNIDTMVSVWVNKAKPNPSLPANILIFTGDTLISAKLPNQSSYASFEGSKYGSWQWVDPYLFVEDSGYCRYPAIFTPHDTANWDTVVRTLTIYAVKRIKVYITKSTETTMLYFVVDSCTTNEVDIYFEVNSNIKVIYNGQQITQYPGFQVNSPGVYALKYTLAITVDSIYTEKEQTLYIERRLKFSDVVRQKYNKVLFVNNNPLTTGYRFVAYQWYRGGVAVGDGQQYYYEENIYGDADVLAPSTPYSVTVTTDDGRTISTCDGYATQVALYVRVYPNPARRGTPITIEFPASMVKAPFNVKIFYISGALLGTFSIDQGSPQIPTDNFSPGIYVLKSEIGETLFVVE